MKAIAFCGSTPENFAKVMMIQNQLSKRGAQSRHIADALKKLAGFDKRTEAVDKVKKVVVEEKVYTDCTLGEEGLHFEMRVVQYYF